MGDEVKFIIERLNDPPFRKGYTLVTFDQLSGIPLLQQLNDVFAELNPQHKIDIREEQPESTVIRMLEFLRILKYKQPNPDVAAFRRNLISGDRQTIYHILHTILSNFEAHKQRAYLARFLVRIEVPDEYLTDEAVENLNEQYLMLIDQFKEAHKMVTQLRSSGFSPADIKKDLANMEEEKEQILKRIDKLKKRVEGTRNVQQLLEVSSSLRKEKETEANLAAALRDQRAQLQHAEQRYQRTQQGLKELRASSANEGPEGILKRLTDENKMNKYLATEKLPKAIEERKAYCQQLQKVLNEPAKSEQDILQLHDQIRSLNIEINGMIEKRMVKNDPIEDKLSIFRQQASIIARKKESAEEKLREALSECTSLEQQYEKKQEMAKSIDGAQVLKGEEFKKYVNQLRGKSTVYKKKKAELTELRAEFGIVQRTEAILHSRAENVDELLSALEAKKGVSGFREMQDNLEMVSSKKAELDEHKAKTLEQISDLVQKLNTSISEKKTKLAPVIRDLRAMRQKCHELEVVHGEKKSAYDQLNAQLESSRFKTEQEVATYREECIHEESRFHYLKHMSKILDIQISRVQDEMKIYVANAEIGEGGTSKKKSFRDTYTKKLVELENHGKQLKEQHKIVKETHEPNMRQLKMWSDLKKIMSCKRDCFAAAQAAAAAQRADLEHRDHLVL
eukprot:Colp12_sorted_trinity150504_noHs@30998